MPTVQMLIKPVSGSCNLRCRYCFYCDEMEKRRQASFGRMSAETLEQIVRKVLRYAGEDGSACVFSFQGGEPTLAGLSFFEQLLEFEDRYNVNGVRIGHAIQTNGYALDRTWAEFFAEHGFLVGVSVDGLIHTHDRYRKTPSGDGSFRRVIENIGLLREKQVDFNILTVVNRDTAMRIRKIYEYYKKQGFRYLQFIPCLDPLGEEPGHREYSLTPAAYGQFLCDLFDLWYYDWQKGEQPYIRDFENYIGILLGVEPEACSMRGTCSIQLITEADGSVYPCDFYAVDRYRIGSFLENEPEEILRAGLSCGFVEESFAGKEACAACPFAALCRGGCRRHRMQDESGVLQGNYYCESYRKLFREKLSGFREIAAAVRRRRPAGR